MSGGAGPMPDSCLDGFGIGDGGPADATAVAHTPFFDAMRAATTRWRAIETSGEAVGLPARPDGQLRGRAT